MSKPKMPRYTDLKGFLLGGLGILGLYNSLASEFRELLEYLLIRTAGDQTTTHRNIQGRTPRQ